MPKYLVIHPVEHDGKRHEPESVISVSETVAAPLLAVGAVVEQDAANRRAKAAAEKSAADLAAKRAELQQQIDAAMAAMPDAESDEARSELQQQIDAATAELSALG